MVVVASDTILSGMVRSLLPEEHFDVSAILPSDQCPGHYDMKLSDIEKAGNADLIVSFSDVPFMEKARTDPAKCILLDQQDRNCMAPDSYIWGLDMLAKKLAERYPELEAQIASRCQSVTDEINENASLLRSEIKHRGMTDRPVLTSSMQREPIEWMGFRVAGEYGRPESISVREIVRLTEIGRQKAIVLVVDNLQSGPDAGKGIAEELGIPHVTLSNFPSNEGYLSTLRGNVAAVLNAVEMK